MKNYCTLSDHNYLLKGLTLYKSLCIQHKGKPDWILYYLCMDTESYDRLRKLNLPNIEPIALWELESQDEQLVDARNHEPRIYGDQWSQFCWTLTPYFIWWLLRNRIIANQSLIYMDSDLYFYHTPELIEQACAGHSVGIHQQRNHDNYNEDTDVAGKYNVGCLYFKCDAHGLKVAEWWKGVLLDPDNQWYEKYGTCGDQKYLDLFIPLFGAANIKVFDEDNSGIAHGAPWNYNKYEFISADVLIWKNKSQILLFNHFSHFNYDFVANTWSSSHHGEWRPELISGFVRHYYDQYFEAIKKSHALVEESKK